MVADTVLDPLVNVLPILRVNEWKQVLSSVSRLDSHAGHSLLPTTILPLSIHTHSTLVFDVQKYRANRSLLYSLSLVLVQPSELVDGRAANLEATYG